MSVSLTRRETSFSSSRNRRSRRWREVTNLPSRPANGESLTEKVISTVGSEILTNGSAVSYTHLDVYKRQTRLTAILQPLGCIALLLDAFRAQKEYIRLEVDKT